MPASKALLYKWNIQQAGLADQINWDYATGSQVSHPVCREMIKFIKILLTNAKLVLNLLLSLIST